MSAYDVVVLVVGGPRTWRDNVRSFWQNLCYDEELCYHVILVPSRLNTSRFCGKVEAIGGQEAMEMAMAYQSDVCAPWDNARQIAEDAVLVERLALHGDSPPGYIRTVLAQLKGFQHAAHAMNEYLAWHSIEPAMVVKTRPDLKYLGRVNLRAMLEDCAYAKTVYCSDLFDDGTERKAWPWALSDWFLAGPPHLMSAVLTAYDTAAAGDSETLVPERILEAAVRTHGGTPKKKPWAIQLNKWIPS